MNIEAKVGSFSQNRNGQTSAAAQRFSGIGVTSAQFKGLAKQSRKPFAWKKMRETGIEPAHLSVLDPKSSASASSATLASSLSLRT